MSGDSLAVIVAEMRNYGGISRTTVKLWADRIAALSAPAGCAVVYDHIAFHELREKLEWLEDTTGWLIGVEDSTFLESTDTQYMQKMREVFAALRAAIKRRYPGDGGRRLGEGYLARPIESALAAPKASDALCPVCRGNDGNAPCAYPGGKQAGCLRDARLTTPQADPAPSVAVLAWYTQSACGGPLYMAEDRDAVKRYVTKQNADQDLRGISACFRQQGPFPLCDARIVAEKDAALTRAIDVIADGAKETEAAEQRAEALAGVLQKIVSVHACDYEYQRWARTALLSLAPTTPEGAS